MFCRVATFVCVFASTTSKVSNMSFVFTFSWQFYQILDTRYWIPETVYQILDTRYCIPDTGYQRLYTRYWTPDTVYQILDTRYCKPDNVYQILYTRYCIPDTGYQRLYTRYWTPDNVYQILYTRYCVPDTVYQILCTRYCIPDTVSLSRPPGGGEGGRPEWRSKAVSTSPYSPNGIAWMFQFPKKVAPSPMLMGLPQ